MVTLLLGRKMNILGKAQLLNLFVSAMQKSNIHSVSFRARIHLTLTEYNTDVRLLLFQLNYYWSSKARILKYCEYSSTSIA
jgi:hypothetical protein